MKRIKYLIAIAFLTMLLSINVFAYTNPVVGSTLERGVGNVTYTVSSGSSAFTSIINDAANNWVYTGWANPINMTAVSSSVGSTIDIYAYTNSTDGMYAYTTFWIRGSKQLTINEISYTQWFYNEVNINKGTSTSSTLPATMRHEFGHCFGMDENNGNPYSIMGQAKYRAVSTVQKCDNDTIVELYGN